MSTPVPQPTRSLVSRFFSETVVVLETALPRAVCVERIRHEIGSWWPMFAKHTVLGRVDTTGFELHQARFLGPGTITARGRWESQPYGTRAVMTVGPPRLQTAFNRLWLAGLLVMTIGWFWEAAHATKRVPIPWLLLPLGMLVLGAGKMAFTAWRARNEPRFLIDITARMLDGRLAARPQDLPAARLPLASR